MSGNAKNTINTSELYETEDINANNDRISSELIKEGFRANLEPLNEQMSNLTQLLYQLIHDSSAGSRIHVPQTGSSLEGETGTSRTALGPANGGTRATYDNPDSTGKENMS